MPSYETIFEDGSYAVATYDDDEEAIGAAGAHHTRATRGEPALLSDPDGKLKATRIVKLIRYEQPPGDLHENQTLSADVASKELSEALKASTKDGVTDLRELAAHIRDLSNPLIVTGPHDSNYEAEGKELTLPWVEA